VPAIATGALHVEHWDRLTDLVSCPPFLSQFQLLPSQFKLLALALTEFVRGSRRKMES